MIHTLQGEFPNVPIGYSGHETGLQTTLAAVAIGAVFVERHITLDRAMWGSDQAASVEPQGLAAAGARRPGHPEAMGDGVKRIYDGEIAAMKKLRRVSGELADEPRSGGRLVSFYAGPRAPGAGREPSAAAERHRTGAGATTILPA